MASVELKPVARSYDGTQQVVHGIDLEIQHGEFVVFLDPSECRGSPLLRIFADLEGITTGDNMIEGKRSNNIAPQNRDVSMVFPKHALSPHKALYENRTFGLRLRKTPEEETDRRVMDAAQLLPIDHVLARKPAALSGGKSQRVATARAFSDPFAEIVGTAPGNCAFPL